jgi:hypothetical protein
VSERSSDTEKETARKRFDWKKDSGKAVSLGELVLDSFAAAHAVTHIGDVSAQAA